MAGLSLNGRDQMLAAFFAPENFATPDSLWVALCTVLPMAGATGNDLIEPEDPAYARAEYSLGADFWANTERGGVTNTSDIVFPELSDDYGDVVGWALCDDAYGGNTYVVGELTSPMSFFFDPDALTFAVIGAGGIVVRQS